MGLINEESFMQQDREDLLAILNMRFGEITADVLQMIEEQKDLNTLQRLILVASNAPVIDVFLEEIREGDQAYKLIGERYNPMGLG